jgi:hypothetical protein
VKILCTKGSVVAPTGLARVPDISPSPCLLGAAGI